MGFSCMLVGHKGTLRDDCGALIKVSCERCKTFLYSIPNLYSIPKPVPEPVDAGNKEDTLSVGNATQGAVLMANTTSANWQLASVTANGGNYAAYATNTTPMQASVYYGTPATHWGIGQPGVVVGTPQTVWYQQGASGLQSYDPFLVQPPVTPLLPEPAFSEDQIEEALEFINGG